MQTQYHVQEYLGYCFTSLQTNFFPFFFALIVWAILLQIGYKMKEFIVQLNNIYK